MYCAHLIMLGIGDLEGDPPGNVDQADLSGNPFPSRGILSSNLLASYCHMNAKPSGRRL